MKKLLLCNDVQHGMLMGSDTIDLNNDPKYYMDHLMDHINEVSIEDEEDQDYQNNLHAIENGIDGEYHINTKEGFLHIIIFYESTKII